MTIKGLIEMAERRLAFLGALRSSAERLGDSNRVSVLDADIAETQSTLDLLRAIPA